MKKVIDNESELFLQVNFVEGKNSVAMITKEIRENYLLFFNSNWKEEVRKIFRIENKFSSTSRLSECRWGFTQTSHVICNKRRWCHFT